MELYEIRSFSIDVGLIEPPIPFPSHTIPIAHIIPISGNCMELYEIRSFPIDKTIESHYMASYGFDMVGNVPYQKHMKSIYGPYMAHTTQFGKGGSNPNEVEFTMSEEMQLVLKYCGVNKLYL